MDLKIRNAIISVSDKTGLEEFAGILHGLGVRIYSTGGTALAIEKVGIPVTKISEYTGFPEILGGRVKSLHPKIHGGILAKRDDDGHLRQMEEHGIVPFDLVVINLYPFERVIGRREATVEEAIENIDIGGPSMLRSTAKNYRYACVVSDPGYYPVVTEELKKRGAVSLKTREMLAMAVFEKTAAYDSLIAGYFGSAIRGGGGDTYPRQIHFHFVKRQELRYGENPAQTAAFYTSPHIDVRGVSTARTLHGKELSFNNILDLEAAFEIVKEFDGPACSIIKHTNPCGAASAGTLEQAILDAHACDPVSAFGSIVGCNRKLDAASARALSEIGFVECVIAPGYDEDGLHILTRKKNIRLLEAGDIPKDEAYDYDMKRVIGGVLVQERDLNDVPESELQVVTEKGVSAEQMASLLFAWKIVKHVKSNAIVLARDRKTVGVGAGQMSRIDATFIALHKAGDRARGSVLASDAFFPKDDGIRLAGEHGVAAVIQPGGSIRDEDAVRACNEYGIAMVFTGLRHFKH
jgi:phosphoribosylaminoimidazolecarboxamide formyltransferase/IMP cyclohydrolase